jgi:hypothetical protein
MALHPSSTEVILFNCQRTKYLYFDLNVDINNNNCINVSYVEGDTARGTTTLVYLQLHISLYTGAVHVLRKVVGVHPPV